MKTLQRTIMRRVYYSYAVSFFTQAVFWQGAVLGVCVVLFGRLTHVAAIAHNFSATKVENIPGFIYNSFLHALNNGEVLTVLVSLFMIGLIVKFLYRVGTFFSSQRTLQAV